MSTTLDWAKWLIAIAILIMVAFANEFYVEQIALLYRVVGICASVMVAAVLLAYTTQGASFMRLMRESRIEIRKVVWPTRQETLQTTLVVIAVIFVVGLLLWGIDSVFSWLVSIVLG